MKKLLVLIILFPLMLQAEESSKLVNNEFMWKYAEFMELVRAENWEGISAFERENTKCGFGQGEEGVGCIKKTINSRETCKADILFSLKQGCKMTHNNDVVSCVSPPQWGDESVIILGGRVSLVFNIKNKQTSVSHFICGGD